MKHVDSSSSFFCSEAVFVMSAIIRNALELEGSLELAVNSVHGLIVGSAFQLVKIGIRRVETHIEILSLMYHITLWSSQL